jgi:hypothetical protein
MAAGGMPLHIAAVALCERVASSAAAASSASARGEQARRRRGQHLNGREDESTDVKEAMCVIYTQKVLKMHNHNEVNTKVPHMP